MSLWKIAWRSIQRRRVASLLTTISMALGVALVVAVLLVVGIVDESFRSNTSLGYNMIVGAKGGELQLVLNTVYYLSQPVENIPYAYYQEFLPADRRPDQNDGKYSSAVTFAIPVCLGDYFGEFRVVGTTTEMFDDLEIDKGRKYEFAEGRNFVHHDPEHGFFEAVLGAKVARETGVRVGDRISPSHGNPDGALHEEGEFHVVGVLDYSGTPVDRAVFLNMEGFFLLDDHAKPISDDELSSNTGESVVIAGGVEPSEHDDHDIPAAEREPLPLEQREVTALLVRTSSELIGPVMLNRIKEGPTAQAVMPIRAIYSLFDMIVKPIQQLLLAISALICVVSGIGILVSIYNSMSDRQQEIAVMRALGAGRATVMMVVLFESVLLAAGGGLVGWLLGHGLVAAAGPYVEGKTGVAVGFFDLAPGVRITDYLPDLGVNVMVSAELLLVPLLIVLAVLVGLLPAVAAYRTDVARALAANP